MEANQGIFTRMIYFFESFYKIPPEPFQHYRMRIVEKGIDLGTVAFKCK